MIKGFTIGCDPEVFIVNAKGEPVSAAGIIPGSKDEPHKVEGGSIHPDGMAAEFGIDPCTTFKEFDNRVTAVMAQLSLFLPEGHSLSIVPAVEFSPEEFDKAPDDAKELGCNPDFDAYTGEINPIPHCDNPRLRTASGHVHIGFKDGPFDVSDPWFMGICCEFVKQLDWFIGGWSLNFDKDPRRRQLYGRAGAFRPKEYGVEYRVPSNFWLVNSNRRKSLWNRLEAAIVGMKERYLPDYKEATDLLRQQINETKLNQAFVDDWYSPLVSLNHY